MSTHPNLSPALVRHGIIPTIVSFTATVVFGIWSVLSYKAIVKGNHIASLSLQQAVIQNQLALLNWCESVEVSTEIRIKIDAKLSTSAVSNDS